MTTDEDREADEFFGQIILHIRKGIVASLLKGNDTCCFTTEQYQTAYRTKFPPVRCGQSEFTITSLTADMHLRTLGTLDEVGPGVWMQKNPGNKEGK